MSQIFQALSPTLVAGFSDNAGRRPAYILCFSITIASNIALALQSNYAALLALRCIQAAGSAGTVALSYGVVADITSSSERGQFMAWASISTMVGPAVAPILGGILSQYAGWHWIFWFTVILAVVVGLPIILFMPETCRKIVGNGSIPPPLTNMSVLDFVSRRKARRTGSQDPDAHRSKANLRFPNPLATLTIIGNLEAFLVLLGTALPAATLYAILTGIPSVFANTYHLSTVIIGLVYLPFGVGSVVAALVFGKIMDWNYRRHAKRLGFPLIKNKATDLRYFPLELVRLEQAIPIQILSGATIISYGWAIAAHAHLSVPLILLGIYGFVIIGVFQLTNALLIDLHPKETATASAASNLVRGLLGAGAAAIVGPMLESMLGRGGTYTIVGGILVLFCPMYWALIKWGPAWRERKIEREEKKAKAQALTERGKDLEQGEKTASPTPIDNDEKKNEQVSNAQDHD